MIGEALPQRLAARSYNTIFSSKFLTTMNYHIVKARVIRFFLVCSLCIVAFTLGGCSKSSVVDTTDTSTDVTNEADVSVQSLDFGATLASLPLELSIANPKDRWRAAARSGFKLAFA